MAINSGAGRIISDLLYHPNIPWVTTRYADRESSTSSCGIYRPKYEISAPVSKMHPGLTNTPNPLSPPYVMEHTLEPVPSGIKFQPSVAHQGGLWLSRRASCFFPAVRWCGGMEVCLVRSWTAGSRSCSRFLAGVICSSLPCFFPLLEVLRPSPLMRNIHISLDVGFGFAHSFCPSHSPVVRRA